MTKPAADAPSATKFTIGIVGVGLIGGSIAAALKKRSHSGTILGIGRSLERLQAAIERGLIDEATTDLRQAASRCEVLVFCTPVDRIAAGVLEAAETCQPGTLITDGGSVKETICQAISGNLPEGVTFIGSHPLAGSEKAGFEYADPELFVGRTCVLTPTQGTTDSPQLEALKSFWRGLGFTHVPVMSPREHDDILALTSHLPHTIASALAGIVDSPEIQAFTSTGFRDTTRIAAGDPDLWVAILLNNPAALLKSLEQFSHRLGEFRAAIENADAATLKNLLLQAKRNRDALDA